MSATVLRIAVSGPFAHGLDYLYQGEQDLPGKRVEITVGKRQRIGLVLAAGVTSTFAHDKLKFIDRVIDEAPLLTKEFLDFLSKVASYYQASIGDMIETALPKKIRAGEIWQEIAIKPKAVKIEAPVALTGAQQAIVTALETKAGGFGVKLLQGVTGSGKTEIYLAAIEKMIEHHRQVLVLVPEIGLTPQTLARFRARFGAEIGAYHSALSEKQKEALWYQVQMGRVQIVIGTRSAIFLPFAKLGMIIVDEEHDLSYKQQNGVRYHARDVAVWRAKVENVPVVLGSATPSLESLQQARAKKYELLLLNERIGKAELPTFHLIDMRQQKLQDGLSQPLIDVIKKHLEAKGQVLLFLNRRGYSPVFLCHDCGQVFRCHHCDANLTLHLQPRILQCHHCSRRYSVPKSCPSCRQTNLLEIGVGTERLEAALIQLFPKQRILRIDRDSVKKKGALDAALSKMHALEADILIGTQMIAKGHDFGNVSMAAIIDSDQSLFSSDFRAEERLGQLITQVAGRSGRREGRAEMYIQTHQPAHPLLKLLLKEGYGAFADAVLSMRQAANLPPFFYFCFLRAEGKSVDKISAFLASLKEDGVPWQALGLTIYGPMPHTLFKKADVYRLSLLFAADHRKTLQHALAELNQHLRRQKLSGIRLFFDVDPMDTA